jgi:hypothetical protein
MPSRKSSAKSPATLLADPDSQAICGRFFAGTCDRTSTGLVAAAPPSSVMNSRLRILSNCISTLPAKASSRSQHIELAASSQPGGLLCPQHVGKRK